MRPSGAAKSTRLYLVSGLDQPDAGSLYFDGKNLSGLPARRRVRLGIARTFQKIRLFKQLTLLENVLAGFHIHHDTPFWRYLIFGDAGRYRDEARELLAFVRLGARAQEGAGAVPSGRRRMGG